MGPHLYFIGEGYIMDYQEIYLNARKWAHEAGEILREAVTEEAAVEYKTSAADLVTKKDKEIEAFFAERIQAAFPEHFILGEEGMAADQAAYDPQKEIVWLVDPIDGTTNFVHHKRNFCISVGIYDQGRPVAGIIYDPIGREMFHTLSGHGVYINDQLLDTPVPVRTNEQALISMNHLWLAPNVYLEEKPLQQMTNDIRGFRCIGSAALELAYVAAGRLDGAIFIGLGPWDFGAGNVLLQEREISITTVHGEALDVFHQSSVVAGAEKLHQTVLSNYIQPK